MPTGNSFKPMNFRHYEYVTYNFLFSFLDNIKSLQFTSWWVENGEKNLITIVFRLDGNPHEIIIKDTKYYVKELYSADKRNTTQLACWDLHVGA